MQSIFKYFFVEKLYFLHTQKTELITALIAVIVTYTCSIANMWPIIFLTITKTF